MRNLFEQIPLAKLELLCQQFGVGLRAGADLLKLLESAAKQGSPRHREIMRQVWQKVREGESLAASMGAADGYFPPLLVQMVSAGETSGGLDRIFDHMANHFRELRFARQLFLGQIAWPLIQLGMAIGVICLVIAVRGLVASRGPETMSFDPLGLGLSGASGVAVFLGWTLFLSIMVAGVIVAVWKNLFDCHRWLIPLILPLPVIGAVFSNAALARMSMTLSMLLNAGVDAIRCVREAFLSTGNGYYIQGLAVAVENVQRGQSLAASLSEAKVFPPDFIHGIEVGELSGNETESLEYLAAEYGRRARSALTQLSVLTSVAIWVAIALLIIYFILRMAMQYVNMLQSLMP